MKKIEKLSPFVEFRIIKEAAAYIMGGGNPGNLPTCNGQMGRCYNKTLKACGYKDLSGTFQRYRCN